MIFGLIQTLPDNPGRDKVGGGSLPVALLESPGPSVPVLAGRDPGPAREGAGTVEHAWEEFGLQRGQNAVTKMEGRIWKHRRASWSVRGAEDSQALGNGRNQGLDTPAQQGKARCGQNLKAAKGFPCSADRGLKGQFSAGETTHLTAAIACWALTL